MKSFACFILGCVTGCFYGLYQTVEAPSGAAVSIMRGIKAIIEVFGQ